MVHKTRGEMMAALRRIDGRGYEHLERFYRKLVRELAGKEVEGAEKTALVIRDAAMEAADAPDGYDQINPSRFVEVFFDNMAEREAAGKKIRALHPFRLAK